MSRVGGSSENRATANLVGKKRTVTAFRAHSKKKAGTGPAVIFDEHAGSGNGQLSTYRNIMMMFS